MFFAFYCVNSHFKLPLKLPLISVEVWLKLQPNFHQTSTTQCWSLVEISTKLLPNFNWSCLSLVEVSTKLTAFFHYIGLSLVEFQPISIKLQLLMFKFSWNTSRFSIKLTLLMFKSSGNFNQPAMNVQILIFNFSCNPNHTATKFALLLLQSHLKFKQTCIFQMNIYHNIVNRKNKWWLYLSNGTYIFLTKRKHFKWICFFLHIPQSNQYGISQRNISKQHCLEIRTSINACTFERSFTFSLNRNISQIAIMSVHFQWYIWFLSKGTSLKWIFLYVTYLSN